MVTGIRNEGMFGTVVSYVQHLKSHRADLPQVNDGRELSVRRILLRFCLPHFLLSGFVGLLVYLLTSTILSDINLVKTPGFSINIICWLLALSFSVAVHVLEDYVWRVF